MSYEPNIDVDIRNRIIALLKRWAEGDTDQLIRLLEMVADKDYWDHFTFRNKKFIVVCEEALEWMLHKPLPTTADDSDDAFHGFPHVKLLVALATENATRYNDQREAATLLYELGALDVVPKPPPLPPRPSEPRQKQRFRVTSIIAAVALLAGCVLGWSANTLLTATTPSPSPVFAAVGTEPQSVNGGFSTLSIYQGSDLVLTNNTNYSGEVMPAWAPSGALAVAALEGLFVISDPLVPQSDVTTLLPRRSGERVYYPAWSHDGNYIAYTLAQLPGAPNEPRCGDIYIVRADGVGDPINVIEHSADSPCAWAPAWSPDDNFLAFTLNEGIRVLPIQVYLGTNPPAAISAIATSVWIDTPQRYNETDVNITHVHELEWSADGNYVLYQIGVSDIGGTAQNYIGVSSVPNECQLGPTPRTSCPIELMWLRNQMHPSISEDGTRIGFAYNMPLGGWVAASLDMTQLLQFFGTVGTSSRGFSSVFIDLR